MLKAEERKTQTIKYKFVFSLKTIKKIYTKNVIKLTQIGKYVFFIIRPLPFKIIIFLCYAEIYLTNRLVNM